MKIILNIGTNIGDRVDSINNAINLLEDRLESQSIRSRMFESPPYGPQDQDNFINISVEIDTHLNLAPLEILKECKDIETRLGRKHRYHWGPREIDIDIIFIDKISFDHELLTIPHKEFRNRSFVLEPLKDLPCFDEYQQAFKIEELTVNDATPLE